MRIRPRHKPDGSLDLGDRPERIDLPPDPADAQQEPLDEGKVPPRYVDMVVQEVGVAQRPAGVLGEGCEGPVVVHHDP